MVKVALVTGASSGIGAATAQALLDAGYRVYAAARRVDRMRHLADQGAQLLTLDVTQESSLRETVDTLIQHEGRLDVLINNAGYGSYGALEDVPLSEGRRQFDVNIFGLARLTQLVLPLMRSQGSGRIVNIASIGGKIHEPFGSWYHATKFALEGLSDCLRVELAPFGIDVIVIEPGAIKTEWNAIARGNLLQYSGDTAYGEHARAHARMLASADENKMASAPSVVANTIMKALAARRPKTRYATGGGAKTVLALRALLSDRAFDALLGLAARKA